MTAAESEAVCGKLVYLELAFINFGRAHDAYVCCVGDPKEIFQGITWFDAQRDGLQELPYVDTCDLASQRGSHLNASKVSSNSVSKASTRLTTKVKEAEVEETLAKLRLQQLKKEFELQQICVMVMHEEELLELRSKIEQAHLKVQILEEEDQSEKYLVCRHGSP